MSQVFIIGATGGVGRRLRKQLSASGHQVTGLHRKPEQAAELAEDKVRPVELDLLTTNAESLAQAMQGSDVVVFSAGAAGAGVELTDGIDGRGAQIAAEAARIAGVKRFILVSAFPDAGRGKQISPTFEHYMKVKRQADVMLAATDLDWVILRPGTLTNEAGSGKVNVGLAIAYGEIPRDDVAAVLHSLVEHPEVKRVIIELTEGQQPIDSAVQQVGAYSGR